MNFESARASLIEDKAAAVPIEDYSQVFAEASPKLLMALFINRKRVRSCIEDHSYLIADALEDIFLEYAERHVTPDKVQELVNSYHDEQSAELQRRRMA